MLLLAGQHKQDSPVQGRGDNTRAVPSGTEEMFVQASLGDKLVYSDKT